MPTLAQKLPLPDRRPDIISACCQLLDSEVAKKGGISGFAVKTTYKLFKAIKPNMVREAVDGLFDDFVSALDGLHGEYENKGQDSKFGNFLTSRTPQAAEALLSVTDERARKTKHASLRGLYNKLRDSAKRHVEEAIPGLAQLIDRYYQ